MTDGSSTNLLAVTQTAEETNSDDEPPSSSSDWYLLTPNQIAPQFYNDAEQGLGRAETAKRSKPHDGHALTSIPQHATLSLLGAQFNHLIILIQTVEATISILLHAALETFANLTSTSRHAVLIPPGEIS